MSEQLSYHNQLIEQGYSEEEAIEHTVRYFPDFSLDGRKPDPAPPPGHEEIPSNSLGDNENNNDSFNFDKMMFKAGLFYDSTKDSIKEHKKIDQILKVTVEFVAEVITCIKDKEKKIISGDPEKVKKIYDTWVFSRDLRSNNPNWLLVDTLT